MNPKSVKTIKVGICGLGTVGAGTFSLLQENQDEIRARLGGDIEVVSIASRNLDAANFPGVTQVGSDVFAVVNEEAVDIVVETLGGFDPAFEAVRQALSNGKHVVTANKALIAERGSELFPIAHSNGVYLAYESAVAGGIPIIKALREGLTANKIEWLAGIINGTGNFILTEMAAHARQFDDVLLQAQALGYAEADPAFDVDGIDAAHKLSIMAAIAFGIPLQFHKTYTEGISHITPEDIHYAAELGYRIKHLGIAKLSAEAVELRVHPTLISRKRLLANVDGVGNAVVVHGNAVGSTLYSGPGAGAQATASAVVADIIDIGRAMLAGLEQPLLPALGFQNLREEIPVLDIEEIVSEYYLRISAQDKVGVMAKISDLLQQHAISIEAVIQKEAVSESVPIVILTHSAIEKQLNLAIAAIENLEDVNGAVMRIRVESFGGK